PRLGSSKKTARNAYSQVFSYSNYLRARLRDRRRFGGSHGALPVSNTRLEIQRQFRGGRQPHAITDRQASGSHLRENSRRRLAHLPGKGTRLGCAYHWEAARNQFVCPCHESRFSIDGKVLGGPAARPLDRYPVRVENSKLLIGSEIRKA